ncbi:uncharacterized protein C9orf152 homolog [Rhynchonycteris naso]
MRGPPCPCLCPAYFWQLGSSFMAEGARTQVLGEGPPLSIQLLRAQYRGLKQQQRTQAHLVVLPKGGITTTPAEPMVSAVWINKDRRSSLPLDEGDPEAVGTLEEADRSYLQVPGSPWHTHLQMHCSVQAVHREPCQVKHKGKFMGSEQRLPQERDPGLLEHKQMTQQGTMMPEVGNTQTKAVGSGLSNGIRCTSPMKNTPRPEKPAHYPFPQRKTPRISQAARNLGLYGPV